MSGDEIEIYKEGEYRLYECIQNRTIYLMRWQSGRLTDWTYLGSADILRHYDLNDKQKVQKTLNGDLYRVMTIKPYDPDTDSDAELVGEPCSKDEAIKRLWEIRYNICG